MSADRGSSDLRRRLTERFPLFGLVVRTPLLTLSMPSDPELLELVDVVDAGIHDPSVMPFRFAWTDGPPAERARQSLAFWWRVRATWSPDDWHWCGAVHVGDRVVGVQDVLAAHFGALREVTTGSWIGQPYQGRGIGTEMRAAALQLAFDGLGAERAHSGYLDGNEASRRVSESLGYVPNGYATVMVRGRAVREHIVVLERSTWEARRRDDITIEGLDGCRHLFGIGPAV